MAPEPRSFQNTCCCGIPLRVGCFILGYLSLIGNAYRLLNYIGLATLFVVTNGFQDNLDLLSKDMDEETATVIGVVLVVVLIVNVVWFGFNIAVLVGLHKRRPGPIRLYVVFASIRLALAILEFISLLIRFAGDIQPLTIIGTIIELSLFAYFIFVYHTYAAQLENELKEIKESARTDQTVDAQEFTNGIAFIYPTKIDKEFLIPPKGGLV